MKYKDVDEQWSFQLFKFIIDNYENNSATAHWNRRPVPSTLFAVRMPSPIWGKLSSNPNINRKVIQAYPDKPWNWNIISKHKFI